MAAAGNADRAGGPQAILVRILRRNEFFKFLFLLPPGAAVISREVRILLEGGVIVRREHFGMGVDVNPLFRALFKEHFQIPEIMSRNENAGIVPHSEINFGNLRIAVSGSVGFIQQGHSIHSVFAGFHSQ